MFWDKISPLYDLFENIYNGKVYSGTGKKVSELIENSDEVLECACGTGAISIYIAGKCRKLTATDFAEGMLRQYRYRLLCYRRTDALCHSCDYEEELAEAKQVNAALLNLDRLRK